MLIACTCRKGNTRPTTDWKFCPMHGKQPDSTLTIFNGIEGEVLADSNKQITLSVSDSNHLRRLLGWIACEIGQSPEEMVETVKQIAPYVLSVGPISEEGKEGKERMSEAYKKSMHIPKYIRAAIKALRKNV